MVILTDGSPAMATVAEKLTRAAVHGLLTARMLDVNSCSSPWPSPPPWWWACPRAVSRWSACWACRSWRSPFRRCRRRPCCYPSTSSPTCSDCGSYRRNFDRRNLAILLPAAIFGVGVGWATATIVSERIVTLLVGIIGLAYCLDHWWTKRGRSTRARYADVPRGLLGGRSPGSPASSRTPARRPISGTCCRSGSTR